MDGPIFGLVGCCFGLLGYLLGEVAGLKKRLADLDRIEAKLDLLLNHQGLTYDPTAGLPANIAELMRSGKKIAAIKAYREATGSSLVVAKNFVESLPAASKTPA